MDDLAELMLGTVFLGLLIAAFVYGIIFFVPLAVVLLVVGLGGATIYSALSPNSQRNIEKAQIAETNQLYEQVRALSPISADQYSEYMAASFNSLATYAVAMELYAMEGYQVPSPPPPIVTGIEGGRYRDTLKRYLNTNHHPDTAKQFQEEVIRALLPFDSGLTDGAFFHAQTYLSNQEIEELVQGFFGDHSYFGQLRDTIDQNFNEQNAVLPSEYTGTNCPWDYLKDTPLLTLERKTIPAQWENRAAHTLILAGSGAGKTTLYKHLIAKLLEEDCCVVVMDSQSQLIEELAHLELEEDDLTWITPEHQLALNPFDVDPDDLKDEQYVINRTALLMFVVEHLMQAEMVPRQRTLFRYCTELVLSIPDGNVATFMEVLQDPYEFAPYIDKLDATARDFFNNKLRAEGKRGNNYTGTREELAYRLDALTSHPVFRRIFQSAENTFDMLEEMEERKLILLDTSHALLGDMSPTLGRFYVAQALQTCFQRVKKKQQGRPVVFLIDEAHEIFDEKLESMLLQARKANVGLVLAMQDFTKAASAGLVDTLLTSTDTKLVSKVGIRDARKLAPVMKTDPNRLVAVPKYSFAFSSGDQQAVTISVDEDPLAALPKRDSLDQLRKDMSYHYGPETEENYTSTEEPTGRYGPNDELKPEPKSAMSQNGNDDIVPTETL